MKNTNIAASKAKTQPHHDDRRADIRDDLDSRKNEENDDQGNNFTNNKKETKAKKARKQ